MNRQQALAFTTLPRITGAMSMLGSAWIAYEVLSTPKKRREVQQRILLGLALTDFITSLHYVLGTTPFPEKYGGQGNELTCDISGFIGQFVPSTAIYNAFLGLFYLYTIKYSWKTEALKKLELCCHISAVSFAIVTGIICLKLKLFNPAFIHCWIADSPKGCTHDPEVECERGNGELAVVLGWAFYYVPVYIGFVVATISMALVYGHVRSVEKASLKYSLGQHRYEVGTSITHADSSRNQFQNFDSVVSNDDADPTTVSQVFKKIKQERLKKEEQTKRLKLSRKVFHQGMWYLLAFMATWFWPTVTTVCESFGYYYYWILVLLAITLPMQGFLNWIIYIRPRFLKYRSNHKDWSFCTTLTRALGKPLGLYKEQSIDSNVLATSGLVGGVNTSSVDIGSMQKTRISSGTNNPLSFGCPPVTATSSRQMSSCLDPVSEEPTNTVGVQGREVAVKTDKFEDEQEEERAPDRGEEEERAPNQ